MKSEKMRIACIFLLLCLPFTACYQQEVKIIKECYSTGNKGFSGRKYICQKMYFINQKLGFKIEYASNGWQIYDSISYKYINGKRISISYRPIYNIGNRKLKGYNLVKIDTVEQKILSGKFSIINDQYHLSKPYLVDLWFLVQRNPKNENNTFKFKDGITPTLFSEYGLPYDELLKSFTFTISLDNLLENDAFFFQDYIVKRKYKYNEHHRLKEVQITVENKRKDITSEYKELFKIIK